MRRISIAALLVLAGALSAPQIASAKVFVGQTNLNIHVKGNTVSGKLAGNPKCRPNQTIHLYIGGVEVLPTTQTDAGGNYFFTAPIVPPTTVQTRFFGSEVGVHPNRFTCLPADSRIVTVKKSKGDDDGDDDDEGSPCSRAATSVAAGVESLSHAFDGLTSHS